MYLSSGYRAIAKGMEEAGGAVLLIRKELSVRAM